MTIQFFDEIPRSRYQSKWSAIGEELRKHKGRWGLVAKKANRQAAASAAQSIKNKTLNLGPGLYEAAARTTDDGRFVVYARFLGDKSTGKAA